MAFYLSSSDEKRDKIMHDALVGMHEADRCRHMGSHYYYSTIRLQNNCGPTKSQQDGKNSRRFYKDCHTSTSRDAGQHHARHTQISKPMLIEASKE